MNRYIKAVASVIISSIIINGCASGVGAYKKGNYYEAVLEAVQNLRRSPENKKSLQVLSVSYQAAINLLTTDIQNQINSNAYLKWKNVIGNYQRINTLYEDIRTCPAALKIIPKPMEVYKDVKVAKDSASTECYNAGIQQMLKGTREDAKSAFFLFTDANNYSPGYREVIELIQQAKTNATLKVLIKVSNPTSYHWNFDPIIFTSSNNQFVAFYTEQQVHTKSIEKIDQHMIVMVNGYQESRPTVSKNSQEYQDNFQTGTKKDSTGKDIPVMQLMKAQATTFDKQILATGSLQFIIEDANNSAQLSSVMIQSDQSWNCRWIICSGDFRALPSAMRNFCGKPELYPVDNQLITQTKKDLDKKLSNIISEFYKNY